MFHNWKFLKVIRDAFLAAKIRKKWQIDTNNDWVRQNKSCFSWKIFEMEFMFLKFLSIRSKVKGVVFRCFLLSTLSITDKDNTGICESKWKKKKKNLWIRNLCIKPATVLKQKQSSRGGLEIRCSKHFGKFTGKLLCQSLFFNDVSWPSTLMKKKPWGRGFPVNIAEFLRKPFL